MPYSFLRFLHFLCIGSWPLFLMASFLIFLTMFLYSNRCNISPHEMLPLPPARWGHRSIGSPPWEKIYRLDSSRFRALADSPAVSHWGSTGSHRGATCGFPARCFRTPGFSGGFSGGFSRGFARGLSCRNRHVQRTTGRPVRWRGSISRSPEILLESSRIFSIHSPDSTYPGGGREGRRASSGWGEGEGGRVEGGFPMLPL